MSETTCCILLSIAQTTEPRSQPANKGTVLSIRYYLLQNLVFERVKLIYTYDYQKTIFAFWAL